MNKEKHQIFCISSDGEHNEGQVWEALMLANKYKLNNLIIIIDRNNIQIDGHTKDIMPLKSLRKKYESFGWHVLEINGHKFEEIITKLDQAKRHSAGPVVVIAKTILGKGVSFMEHDSNWHGKAPSKDEVKQALDELRHEE